MFDEDVERVFVNVGVCEEHGQLDCSGRVFNSGFQTPNEDRRPSLNRREYLRLWRKSKSKTGF
jgi:hypothetical protein